MNKLEFAQLIKETRKEKGFTQKEVAKKLGLLQSTYSNYENGYNAPPADVVNKLSEIFGVDLYVKKRNKPVPITEDTLRSLFLAPGYKNNTEQLIFYEELSKLRELIDDIGDKRERRRIADIFSQILDCYCELLSKRDFEKGELSPQKNSPTVPTINETLERLNLELTYEVAKPSDKES